MDSMNEIATLKVEELPDGTIVLTWDKNDPKCAFLNEKTEEEIIAMIEKGLEEMMKEEEQRKQDRLKSLEEMVKHDQEMGLY